MTQGQSASENGFDESEEMSPDSVYYVLVSSSVGDLNKDGIPDSVCVTRLNYEKDNNRPCILSIYFGKADGGYDLYLRTSSICQHYTHFISEVKIRKNGTLLCMLNYDCNGYIRIISRFQNNDFYLIGYDDYCEGADLLGSVNFLTKVYETEGWIVKKVIYGDDEESVELIDDAKNDLRYHIDFDSLIPLREFGDETNMYNYIRVGERINYKDTIIEYR